MEDPLLSIWGLWTPWMTAAVTFVVFTAAVIMPIPFALPLRIRYVDRSTRSGLVLSYFGFSPTLTECGWSQFFTPSRVLFWGEQKAYAIFICPPFGTL